MGSTIPCIDWPQDLNYLGTRMSLPGNFYTFYTDFNSCCSIIFLCVSHTFRKQLKEMLGCHRNPTDEAPTVATFRSRAMSTAMNSTTYVGPDRAQIPLVTVCSVP